MPKEKPNQFVGLKATSTNKIKTNPPDNQIIETISKYFATQNYSKLRLYLKSLPRLLNRDVVLKKYAENYNLVSIAWVGGHDLVFEIIRLTTQAVFDEACTTPLNEGNSTLLFRIFFNIFEFPDLSENIRTAKIMLEHMSAKAIGRGCLISHKGIKATPLHLALRIQDEELTCLFLRRILSEDLNSAAAVPYEDILHNILHIAIATYSSQKIVDLLMNKLNKEVTVKLLATKNLNGHIPFDIAVTPEEDELQIRAPAPTRGMNDSAVYVLKHVDIKRWPEIISKSVHGKDRFTYLLKKWNPPLFNQLREMQIANRTLQEGALEEAHLGYEIPVSSIDNLRFLVAVKPELATQTIQSAYPEYVTMMFNSTFKARGNRLISGKIEEAKLKNNNEINEINRVLHFFSKQVNTFPKVLALLILSYHSKPWMLELTMGPLTPAVPSSQGTAASP